jgi:hypothetical protein
MKDIFIIEETLYRQIFDCLEGALSQLKVCRLVLILEMLRCHSNNKWYEYDSKKRNTLEIEK